MSEVIATAMAKVATRMIYTTMPQMINTTSMINCCHTEVAGHILLCLLQNGECLYKEERKSVYIDSFSKILKIIRRHLSLSLAQSPSRFHLSIGYEPGFAQQ
jgi:hypothetical protein